MEITESMLRAAMREATEAGLFPRRCTRHELAENRKIMMAVLCAAISHANGARGDGEYAGDAQEYSNDQAVQGGIMRGAPPQARGRP